MRLELTQEEGVALVVILRRDVADPNTPSDIGRKLKAVLENIIEKLEASHD